MQQQHQQQFPSGGNAFAAAGCNPFFGGQPAPAFAGQSMPLGFINIP
jgi:hypothetical protein